MILGGTVWDYLSEVVLSKELGMRLEYLKRQRRWYV